MGEGIKLYKHFCDQIIKIGRAKRAWFTTFDLDAHFFEKFILSALMNFPYRELKSPYDYESLNSQLANEQESLTEDKMEVRVFYDYRALIQTHKPKQTSVHLHPVDIKQLSGLNSSLRFSDGVFHPKIILIESITGEYWLMVSSANLTFGGWSKNRECFFCEKINNTFIGREVGSFFTGIANQFRGLRDNELLNKLNYGKFGSEDSKWYFFSSFNENKFLDQLKGSSSTGDLLVWSPYFANEIQDLVQNLLDEQNFDNISIVPAKNENQKIRITKEAFKACEGIKQLSFKQDKLPASASESFVHAKVWLTPSSLAIGSWNMTKSGMNIDSKKRNNVEAGIIYNLSARDYTSILEQTPLNALKSPGHYTTEEMDEEKKDLLDAYPLAVDLIADWDKLTIKLNSPSITKLIAQLPHNSYVQLPGVGKLSITNLENDVSFREYTRDLLTDRFFQLADDTGKIYYKGYIREIGLVSRPVNSFSNIDDYMKGWVSQKPEDKEELFGPDYPVIEDFGGELNDQTRKILMSNDQNPWFSSFHAFECIKKRINETDQYNKAKKINELKRIGRVLPGSLSELKKHLTQLKDAYLADNNSFLKSPIYLWFLIEKANVIFKYFNEKIQIQEEFIKSIQNIKIESAFPSAQLSIIGADNLQQWSRFIKTKLSEIE